MKRECEICRLGAALTMLAACMSSARADVVTGWNLRARTRRRGQARRSAGQTGIARFWEYSMQTIYYGVLRTVALQPGRDLMRGARLYRAASQAMEGSIIAVYEPMYQYKI